MIILLFKIKFLLSTHIASLRYETVFDGLKFSDARLTGLTVILMFVLIDNIVNFLMVVVCCYFLMMPGVVFNDCLIVLIVVSVVSFIV